MSVATRDIKRRLKGIGGTAKLTKAMELVAASKMRRATQAVAASRPFSATARHIMSRLVAAAAGEGQAVDHPLLAVRPAKRAAVVVYSANRGLCGSFNSQLAAAIQRQVKPWEADGVAVSYLTFGRRVRETLVRRGASLAADFTRPDSVRTSAELAPLTRMVTQSFSSGEYDQVWLAYTDYVSALKQEPRVVPLLPLDASLWNVAQGEAADYKFEPSPSEVLASVLPRLVEVQLWQAALESLASEHASRMLAMRNASDAAADLLGELTNLFNRARQASITAEIAEISGGAAALA
jgi:F-type H+-transporting ATPase subunit gamma